MDEVQRYMVEVDARALSEKTKRLYLSYLKDYLRFSGEIDDFSVKQYLQKLSKTSSRASMNIAISALKIYFSMHNELLEVKRPKKERHLPVVLSADAVKRLFNAVNNPKHKLILKCLYGMGLRVSEVVNLKLSDIDFERKSVHIRQSKHWKDRYVPLPDSIIEDLKFYISLYGPKEYVFTGKGKYSIKSVQMILMKSRKKSRINKSATCHTLRHSYATHLLERGVSIRHIQELLGHSSVRTTMIYTHVAKIPNIRSPLDTL